MAYIRFYSPVQPGYRDENSNEAYKQLIRHINTNSNCGCYQGSVPASNISETDKEFRIEIALPGVDKKNINVRHDKGYLSITVEKPVENESDESYTRHEFDYQGASRTFKTGDKIDADNIAAKYENGILTLTLPKKESYVNKPAQAIIVE
jgi:HSP20 family protein